MRSEALNLLTPLTLNAALQSMSGFNHLFGPTGKPLNPKPLNPKPLNLPGTLGWKSVGSRVSESDCASAGFGPGLGLPFSSKAYRSQGRRGFFWGYFRVILRLMWHPL